MRFPTAREVERAVYYGASMRLKTVDATVRLSTWTASVGAKAALQMAWVKISNIPLDKRCEANVFYAGGLVGVSLDLDASMLHKPEYVKVLIGCRDVELIPASAEGCLGDNFYDFFYEIDKIVVGGPPKTNSYVVVGGSSGAPSPKRASADGNELLIETMTIEHEVALAAGTTTPSNKWLVPCPILEEKNAVPPVTTHMTSMLLPYSHTMSVDAWPTLPTITEVTDASSSPLAGSPAYAVQSPEVSPMEENMVAPEDTRFSTKLQDNVNKNIMDKATEVAMKRNLEGL
ncbi:hypothetical protein ACQ4PT_039287 [Festuca glaucescens]